MSAIKWTQKTDTYWAATIEGYLVEVTAIAMRAFTGRFAYLAIFHPEDGIKWTCGTVNDLADAKHAAEQMAQRWAGKVGE